MTSPYQAIEWEPEVPKEKVTKQVSIDSLFRLKEREAKAKLNLAHIFVDELDGGEEGDWEGADSGSESGTEGS